MDFQNGQTQRIATRNEAPIRSHISPSFHHSLTLDHQYGENQKNTLLEKKSEKFLAILDDIITFSLAALFFGIPIFFIGLTFQGLAFEKQIYFYLWMLVLVVAWTSKGVISGEMRIRRTPLDIPLLGMLIVYVIAAFFSVDRWHSFFGFFGDPSRGLMSFLSLIIVYYAIVSHFTAKRMFQMISSLAVSNFIISIWAFFQIMAIKILPDSIATHIPSSTVGSLSGLGIFLATMLPLLTMLILHLNSEKTKIFGKKSKIILGILFFSLLLNIFLLLTLYSFVSWSGILIGSSIFLIYILARIVRPAENWTWVPMVVFVAILMILMIGNNSIARVNLPVEVSPSYKLSLDIAKESLKNSFLIGSGPATYGYSFSLFHPRTFNVDQFYNLRFYQATGLFFETVSTMGALGAITFMLVVLTFLGSGIYLLSIDKAKNKIYSLGIFTAVIIIIINVFVSKIEASILILGVLLGALAIASLLYESESEKNYLSLSLKASPKYALALAFVFMVVSAGVVFLLVFIGKVFIADLRAGSATREIKITEEGSITKIAQAIGWYNYEGRYFTRLGQEYLVLANNEALKAPDKQDVNLIKKYLQSAIVLAKQGRDMMPTDALAQETLAQVYENGGLYVADSLTMAEESYKKALELEPHNPVYMIKLGQIKIAQASIKGTQDDLKNGALAAKDWFQKAIDEKINLAESYYQMSLAKEVLVDKDGAISAMEKAIEIDKSNVNYVFNLARLHQSRGNEDDKKIAEILYRKILEVNEKDINTHFSLGLLLEKMKKPSDASAEYKKVLELIPADQKDVKTQIQKMISNVAAGIENTPESIKPAATNSAAPAISAPSTAPQTSDMQIVPGLPSDLAPSSSGL